MQQIHSCNMDSIIMQLLLKEDTNRKRQYRVIRYQRY